MVRAVIIVAVVVSAMVITVGLGYWFFTRVNPAPGQPSTGGGYSLSLIHI